MVPGWRSVSSSPCSPSLISHTDSSHFLQVIGWFAGGSSQASLSHDPNDPGAVLALKDEEDIDVALEMEGLRMIVGRFAQAVDGSCTSTRSSSEDEIVSF